MFRRSSDDRDLENSFLNINQVGSDSLVNKNLEFRSYTFLWDFEVKNFLGQQLEKLKPADNENMEIN